MKETRKMSLEVMETIRSGRKITAIKQLREEQGTGLKEAKIIIDAEVAAFRKANPGRHDDNRAEKRSWLLVLVVVIALLYATLKNFT